MVDEVKAKEKDDPVTGELLSLTDGEPADNSVASTATAIETSDSEQPTSSAVSKTVLPLFSVLLPSCPVHF